MMKKVLLHFKDFELGFLTEKDNNYVWVPNSQNIALCFERYDGARDLFYLEKNNPQAYKQIPYHFYEFLVASSRGDFVRKLDIKESDSDFEKLYKMASLSYFNQDFYISL